MAIVPTMMTEQWPRFILPIIRKEWFQKMTSIISPASQLYGMNTSVSSVEYSQGIGDFGLVPEYNSDTDPGNAQIQYDSFNPLYETTFTHKEYALGVQIERKLWDDDRLGNIRSRARTLGNSYGMTIAVHQSSVFNNAFSSSYLGPDAKALVADDHPTSPNNSTAIDNKGTTALSYAAITAALAAGRRLDDDRGNPFPVIYDTLYVPIELEALAYEITAALNKPGTADNDANFLRSKGLSVVVDPYLTDANNWFLIDSGAAREHLLFFWRVRPEIALDPTSDYNLVARYRAYMRFSFGWDDYRFIFGSEVA